MILKFDSLFIFFSIIVLDSISHFSLMIREYPCINMAGFQVNCLLMGNYFIDFNICLTQHTRTHAYLYVYTHMHIQMHSTLCVFIQHMNAFIILCTYCNDLVWFEFLINGLISVQFGSKTRVYRSIGLNGLV